MSGYYENATICLNGHVSSRSNANYREFCKECGESMISNCLNCESPIQGFYRIPNFVELSSFNFPNYCHKCGKPYPWTEKLLNNAIELVSLDEELNENQKEIIKNAIPDLIIESPSTPVAQAKYKKYMSLATEYVQEGTKNLLIDVVSETVKKSLFN